MTVGELRKALKGLPANMPCYNVDHDHSEWETNGRTRYVEVRNQKEMGDHAKQALEDNPFFKIKGEYLAIGV